MGSQYAICFPDKEFLFTCIADTQGAPAGSDIPVVMREELYPHLSDAPLAENRDAHAELADKIERLAVLPIPGGLRRKDGFGSQRSLVCFGRQPNGDHADAPVLQGR